MQYCGQFQRTIHKIRNEDEKTSKNISSKKPFHDVNISYEIFTCKQIGEISLNQYMALHINTALLGIISISLVLLRRPLFLDIYPV